MIKTWLSLCALCLLRVNLIRAASDDYKTKVELDKNLIEKLSIIGHETQQQQPLVRQASSRQLDSDQQINLEQIDNFDNYINNRNGKIADLRNLNRLFSSVQAAAATTTSQVKENSSVMKHSSSSSRGANQMRTIYESLKSGNTILNEKEINTIRLIPCTKAVTNKKLHFLFNLSLISPSESLVKAELYMNKRFVKQKLVFNLHYFLYSTPTSTSNRTTNSSSKKIKITSSTNGFDHASTIIDLNNPRFSSSHNNNHHWPYFNILDSLKSYVSVRNSRFRQATARPSSSSSSRSKNIYYTASFEGLGGGEEHSDQQQPGELMLVMEAAFKRAKKLDKSLYSDFVNPYLIVYSSESEQAMKNFFQMRIPGELASMHRRPSEEEQTVGSASLFNSGNRDEMQSLKNFESQVNGHQQQDNGHHQKAESSKPGLAVSTSEEPRFKVYPNNKDESILFIEQSGDGKNFDSNSLRNKLREARKQLNASDQEIQFLYKTDLNKVLKKRKRQAAAVSYGEEEDVDVDDQQGKLPEVLGVEAWNEIDTEKRSSAAAAVNCEIKPIIMDFSDLSFSDWILEPKSYQSNYCSGVCKFPLSEVRKKSVFNSAAVKLKRNELLFQSSV